MIVELCCLACFLYDSAAHVCSYKVNLTTSILLHSLKKKKLNLLHSHKHRFFSMFLGMFSIYINDILNTKVTIIQKLKHTIIKLRSIANILFYSFACYFQHWQTSLSHSLHNTSFFNIENDPILTFCSTTLALHEKRLQPMSQYTILFVISRI